MNPHLPFEHKRACVLRAVMILIAALFCIAVPAQIRAAMAVDSLTGPITANEITSFKNYMATTTIAANNSGNAWVFGATGHECRGLGLMYEATGDIAMLNRMIQYADTALAGRNNPVTGVVMWTGKRELCWPNSFTEPVYTSCESGEVAGRILFCARLILQTPSIWNNTVAVGDPRGYGATYKARALKYLTECDKTIDTFIVPIWVRPAISNRIYAPSNWNGDGGAANAPVAWNRIAMFLAALQRSAECHEILGDDPNRVTSQYAIVTSNVQWFHSKAVPYVKNGFNCYHWYYSATTTKKEEVWENHGALDIRMLWDAYQRGVGLSKAEMMKYANTFQYSVWTGSDFHAFFDGTDGSIGTRVYTKGEYIDLADFVPAILTTVGNADKSHTSDASMIGPILWMKDRVYEKFYVESAEYEQTVDGGSPATYNVEVSPLGGFNGTVTLAASGLPAGASASFNPASISGADGTSVLTVSTATTTPGGTYTITISGTSGTTVHSTTVSLTVGQFSVDCSNNSQTVTAGSPATYNLVVSSSGGFSGTVSLDASGLPAGASASFSPASISGANGTSVVTVSTASTTPVGTYAITISGTSGTSVRSTTVSLTVNADSGGGDGGITYQAENAVLAGKTVAESTNGGYNGTGYANFPANAGTTTFNNVDGNGGGTKLLTIRYANGSSASRTGNLTVNGVTLSITFPVTGSWTSWATLTGSVALNNGTSNTIQIASTGQDLANIDEITVPPGATTPDAYQAENAVLGGGAVAESVNGGFDGTGYVNFPATGGTLTFNNVDGNGGGTKSLAIRYANGSAGPRTGTLTVNGTAVNITFPVTGAWTTWATLNVNITLADSTSNTIQLASTGQDLANIDQITVP
jgi:Carbohydrate binding module (family 6)